MRIREEEREPLRKQRHVKGRCTRPNENHVYTRAREKTISISWTKLNMERKIKDNDNDKTKKNITDE